MQRIFFYNWEHIYFYYIFKKNFDYLPYQIRNIKKKYNLSIVILFFNLHIFQKHNLLWKLWINKYIILE